MPIGLLPTMFSGGVSAIVPCYAGMARSLLQDYYMAQAGDLKM